MDISTAHSMIGPIVKQDFGNTFHHRNGPNRRHHTRKKTIVNSINPDPIKEQGPHQLNK